MQVIKKINNNVAVCLDRNHRELIAFGKGIGFPPIPYELTDLASIQRTYYGVNSWYLNSIADIPNEIFELSVKIVDIAQSKISSGFNPSLVFTLSDHIAFAIKRVEKRIRIKKPLQHNIRHLYETEMEIGDIAVSLINNELNVQMPHEESVSIALHLINAKIVTDELNAEVNDSVIIDKVIKIIETKFKLSINQNSLNFSRFITHINYLLKSINSDKVGFTENQKLYESLCIDYPEENDCATAICQYLELVFSCKLNKDELLYLMIHINRLCSREDCY